MNKIYLVTLLLILFSCSAQQQIKNNNPHLLSFGSSGGFTNQTMTFNINEDGILWKVSNLKNDSVFIKNLSKGKLRKVLKSAYSYGLDTIKLSKPGNMTKFIRFKSKSVNNKVEWSGNKETMNEFYVELMELTKN